MTADLDKYTAELQALIEDRLRIRARDLSRQTRKAGRLLPRRIRSEIQAVIRAQEMAAHPKLRRMIDDKLVARSHARAVEWLKSVDPKERRKDWWLSMAGSLAFSLLAVTGLVIGVLYWRDLI